MEVTNLKSANQTETTIEQRKIDDQVMKLEARIHFLKTKRNTHARISRLLPPEIISEIFVMAKWSSISSRTLLKLRGGRSFEYCGERNWLNVAGVCTHWRQLALDYPWLWSAINLTRADRALAMIKRSKAVPLDIFCANIADTDDDAHWVVMSNISRIRTLNIGSSNNDLLFKFLRLNERASAPILRTLTLIGTMYSLPKDVLQRDMSSLQELNLIKGTLSIPLPPLPHLKRLLIDPTELLTGHLSDHVLLQALQNTPNLEELRVLKVAVAMLDETLPLVVDLPCLTHLSISGLTVLSSKLFESINYPKAANVNFQCQAFSTGSDLLHLLGALTHFTSLPGRIIREVGVTTQDEFLLTLEGVHQSLYPTPYRFELTLKGPVDFQDEISDILGVVPMSKVSTLRLTGIAPRTIQPRRLFERCGEVKHLHLTACAVEVFSGLKNANDSTLALPNLRTLSVEQCKFTYPNGGRNSKLCKAMTSFLEKRRRLNAVIEEFSICACDVTGSVIKEFEELVDVEWDYQEVEDED